MKNNKEQDENTNGAAIQTRITINIPINTSEAKLKEVLGILDFDEPLPAFDHINLQISIKRGGQNDEQS